MINRGSWGSQIGFILASAGSAIGLGNIWRFPYVTGENGGGAFLIIYILILFTIGISVMLAEFTIGRAGQKNPVGAFKALKGGNWKLVGFIGVIVSFIILSFYSVVGGWTIAYLFHSLTGAINISAPEDLKSLFGNFISNSYKTILYHGFFMVAVIALVVGGIRSGIQWACQVLMPILFFLLIILVGFSLSLPGSWEGVKFFLKPDFSKITADTFSAALAHAFFSLSVGIGALMTYASYLKSEVNLPRSVTWVTSLDFTVAFVAGLVIFPAVFAVELVPTAGPSLTFETLPAVFARIPGASIFATFFFVLLLIAALTSAISLLEVVVAYAVDEHNLSRTRAAIMLGTLIFVFGIPSALSFGVASDITLQGKTFFDWMEFLTTYIGLPVSGLLIALFVGWVIPERTKEEVTSGGTLVFSLRPAWMIMCRIIAPVAIAWILVQSFLT